MPENRQKTDKRKAPRSAWQPGRSGNPGGRPRKTPEQREIEELARRFSVEALNRLREIATKGRDNDAVRACEAILDRAWGRTQQQHVLQGPESGAPTVRFEWITRNPKPKEEENG